MGRRLLLIGIAALAATFAACAEHETTAHEALPCASCHDGAVGARGIAATTSETCRSCHDEGPGEATLGTVRMQHVAHGGDTAIAAGCAACHTHDSGERELTTTTAGCTLCHAASLDASEPADCRLCHGGPQHLGFTSQGVAIPHAELPWIGGECIRCHYDVGQPRTGVAVSRCVECHADADHAIEQGAGRDLHPAHTGVACTTCHADDSHRILAMSSSVSLECGQCHTGAHGVAAGDEPANDDARDAAVCIDCHAAEHAAEQRMVLGIPPGGVSATPSDKFLVGVTCRSCHVPIAGATASTEGRATRVDCVGCHPSEYATVLTWWTRGTDQRLAEVRRYVAAAGGADAAGARSDSTRAHLSAADSLVGFVEAGGAAHNLPLSHAALEEAVARASSAWTAAGQRPPARPDLGRMPRMGQCTYCHYEWREPRFQEEMPDRFHRDVMARGRRALERTGGTTE